MNSPAPSAPAPAVGLERGQTIDRFVVLGLVGRGGMGEVYAAYDPELDRKVAIKLLRARGDSADGRARLLREAQAIAKLSHPNVVVVYDVGTFGDSVFIAMEFVEGHTLSAWMVAAPRTQRDVLGVFLAAARGLAAAHAAGLVHRDFKPDNVMVTNDGQVRVMDFGLARQAGEAAETTPAPPPGVDVRAALAVALEESADETVNLRSKASGDPQTSSGKYLSIKLTQTGAMLGTPAYMAPEQFAMRATDARTDQFSFCVALYELLYGERPFAGDALVTLMANVTTGTVREPPPRSRVRGWLRRVILRGLAVDPERRHPSMNALIAALETDPTVKLRRIAAGAGVLAILALAAVGARRAGEGGGRVCRGAEARWAGVWEANGVPSPRKEAIRRAFDASGRSYAGQAFTNASRLLDDYVKRWLASYVDACEATAVRAEQSNEVLDLRMSCLQERLGGVSALSDVLARADGTVVENAVSAAGALPALERCSDVKTLKAVIKPPEDAATRKRVEELRVEVAHLKAERDARHCVAAKSLAESLIPRLRQVGYEPLLADTLVIAGMLGETCVEPAVGLGWLKEGYLVAVSSGHDEAAAMAAMFMGGFSADRMGRVVEGRSWMDISHATLQRLGHPPYLEAWVLDDDATVLIAEGRGAAAAEVAQRGIDARRKVFGDDHPDLPISINSLGNALHMDGRDKEALAAFAEAHAKFARALGESHPQVAMVLNNQGEVLNALHRYAEARASFARALEIWTESHADPYIRAYGLTGLGAALVGEGEAGKALEPLQEALEIRTRTGSDPEHLAETRFALARALWLEPARRARALELARRAHDELKRSETLTIRGLLADVESWLAAHPS